MQMLILGDELRIEHSKMRSFETKHWMIQQREASRPFLSLSLRFRQGEAHSCEEEEESPEEGGGEKRDRGSLYDPGGDSRGERPLGKQTERREGGRETEGGRAKLEIAEEGGKTKNAKGPRPIFDCTFPRPETCSRNRHTKQRKQTLSHRIHISSKSLSLQKKKEERTYIKQV